MPTNNTSAGSSPISTDWNATMTNTSTITVNHAPSCTRSHSQTGRQSKTWVNKCPMCGATNLKDNPKGTAEGEITCGSCDADFCGACGYEKIEGSQYHLTPANGSGTDNTSGNVDYNDPVKNRKLAEITMAEQLRETYQLKLTIPKILVGLHTNQFFFMDVSDEFYEKNYPEIIGAISDRKFARFAGFKKGRFFVDKVTETGGMNGWKTEITLNPIPPSLATYSKMQMEATKALIEAINAETNKKSGNSGVTANGADCNPTDTRETHHWGGDHRQYPPVCTPTSKTIHGNSSRQYAKDTAAHNGSSQELVTWVKSQCQYWYAYADNPHGESQCPEAMWTAGRPVKGNCADFARLLKCILDVNGYQSITCHIPGHFFNAIWENGGWTICDLCNSNAYGHANHEDEGDCHPIGTWDEPLTDGFTKA